MEDRVVKVRVWELHVGRCRILLLDTDHDGNDWQDRGITRQLYGGDDLNRIRQETVLGLGGVRALREFHLRPAVFHLNEGHCGFVSLALAAEAMHHDPELRWEDAMQQVRKRIVFTTHTPVPAGHDRFSRDLVDRVLGPWRDSLGLPRGTFMDLGRERPGDWEETLSMTVVPLRASTATNGVSALHGHVSRRMFNALWPDRELGVDRFGDQGTADLCAIFRRDREFGRQGLAASDIDDAQLVVADEGNLRPVGRQTGIVNPALDETEELLASAMPCRPSPFGDTSSMLLLSNQCARDPRSVSRRRSPAEVRLTRVGSSRMGEHAEEAVYRAMRNPVVLDHKL